MSYLVPQEVLGTVKGRAAFGAGVAGHVGASMSRRGPAAIEMRGS